MAFDSSAPNSSGEGVLRVLVASGHPVHRAIALRLLRNDGHDVVEASSEVEAASELAAGRFDAAIVDDGHGQELATALDDAIRARGTRVTRLVAEGVARPAEDGCGGIVSLPLRASALRRAVALAAVRPTPGAIRMDEALRRAGGDSRLLDEVVALATAAIPTSLAAIERAVRAADGEAAANASHALKGMVANFGATAAVEAARAVEQASRQGDLALASERLAEMRARMADVLQELAHARTGVSA